MPTAEAAPVPPMQDIPSDPQASDKAAIRKLARQFRRDAAAAAGSSAAEDVAHHLAGALKGQLRGPVSGYWPMGEEIDPRPAMMRLAALGAELALPVVARSGHPLDFRSWQPGQALEAGPHGTFHPSEAAVPLRPWLVLVPLLAFDRTGNRLGYGGGYYDRTLAWLRETGHILAIGLAYAAQEMNAVPYGPHDQRLDGIATERGFIETRLEKER